MTLDPEKIPIIEAPIGATLKTIAGAGTGKTSVLVERYMRFVFEEGIAPGRILALTFTKKAASEIRKRIFEEAAKRSKIEILRELHSAWIMNFHQFSLRIIKESAAAFAVDPGVDVATDLDISRIRHHLYRRFELGTIEGFPDELGDDIPDPAHLRATFDGWFDVIDKARGTLWTPDGLLDAVRAEDPPDYRRVVRSIGALWTAYEGELRRRALIDFADMIRIAVWGLRENPVLRQRYVGTFDHILVDEFQDTSEAQNELLRILSGGDFARVTVVGDDKQSIYRWRDARVQNLREFAGQQHFLRTNHRSTQGILDLAHHFIVSDPYFAKHADDIRLRADRGASGVPICVFHPPDGSEKSHESEARALAGWILSVTGRFVGDASPFSCYGENHRENAAPLGFGDVAVLMRKLTSSSGLPEYECAFRDAGIPYAVSGSGGSLETHALERLRDLLRVLVYPDDVQAFLGVLENEPFSIPDGSVEELFDCAGSAGAFDVDSFLSDEICGRLTSTEARASCVTLRGMLDDLRAKRLSCGLPAFVSYALEAGPFYYGLFDEGADVRLVESVLETVFDLVDRLVARKQANLASFIEGLQVIIAGKALDDGRGSTLPAGRVQIMTVHAAKGLQFPAVAVPGIKNLSPRSPGFHLSGTKGLYLTGKEEWRRGLSDSDTYEMERADRDQEERCLLYVAITRARDHLFMSSPCPNGVERGEEVNLFGVVLDVLRKNSIAFEELREAPDIVMNMPERAGESKGEDGRIGGKDNRTDSGTQRRKDKGADRTGRNEGTGVGGGGDIAKEDVGPLVDQWRIERGRLDAVNPDLLPARDIEFVSWRRLFTFATCPAMYCYRYVGGLGYLTDREEGSPSTEADETDTEEFSGELRLPRGVDRKAFGSLVHRLLYEWMSSESARKAPRDEFVEDLIRRFDSSARAETLHRAAREILDAFVDSDLSSWEHVDGLEVAVEARIDKLVFRGTVDRIDRSNGGCRIIDYKGKTPREEYEYQIRFYAWILRKAGRAVLNEAVLCYLTRPVEAVTVDVSPRRVEEIERDARRLEEAVRAGRFEPHPGGVCETCAFKEICPYARSRGDASRS